MARKKKSKQQQQATTADDDVITGTKSYTVLEGLGEALAAGWKKREFADAKVIAGEGDDAKTFPVNSALLAWRSDYFRNAFYGNFAETSEKVLRKPNVSPRVMEAILGFCYSGAVTLDDDTAFTSSLITASDEMGLSELSVIVSQDFTARMSAETAASYLRNAYSQGVRALKESTLTHVLTRAGEFLEDEEVFTLPLEAMVDIVSSDKLNMGEEDVWEFMLKYAMYKTKVKTMNPLKWTPEERELMQEALAPLLPSLRLMLVDPRVVYKDLEPSGLFPKEDIELRYKQAAVPECVPADHKFLRMRESTVEKGFISPANFRQLCKWLGKRYRWTKLMQASKDGFSASTFHSKCDNKGPTVVFVQVGKYVAGGFAPVSWTSNSSYVNTSKAFLFSVVGPNNTSIVQYPNTNASDAMYCQSGYGPTFGGGHDLYLCDNCNSNNSSYTGLGNSYSGNGASNSSLFGAYNFTVTDYVVYQLQ